MILTVASYKGGVGKTTTAIHLAAYFQTLAPTLLLDADRRTRNALKWSQKGKLPFRVAPDQQAWKLAADFSHIVIDSGQGATDEDVKAAAEGCDLMVIPAVPAPMDDEGLFPMVLLLQQFGAANFRVLFTNIPPDEAKHVLELRAALAEINAPVFEAEIPRLKAYKNASGVGRIVNEIEDRNRRRAWEAYAAAGKEITA